jgi:hypothetical protein
MELLGESLPIQIWIEKLLSKTEKIHFGTIKKLKFENSSLSNILK